MKEISAETGCRMTKTYDYNKLQEENKQLKEDIRKSSENNLNIIDDNVGLKEENKRLRELRERDIQLLNKINSKEEENKQLKEDFMIVSKQYQEEIIKLKSFHKRDMKKLRDNCNLAGEYLRNKLQTQKADIIKEIEELENGELYPSEEIKMGNQIIIDWIKHFFNLEGEE